MPLYEANGIQIEAEVLGPPDAPALLLPPGHEGQLVWWDDRLCEALVERGFRVVRYDNRDAGRSTRCHGAPTPDLAAAAAGDFGSLPYTLRDLADDACGLLDALEVERAHLLGHVMGGMIAQLLAIHHPARVRSAVIVCAGAGTGIHGPLDANALHAFVRLPAERDAHIAERVRRNRAVASPGFEVDEARLRDLMGRVHDRSDFDPDHHVAEELRKIGALLSAVDRGSQLRELRLPVAVVHGDSDSLTPLADGREVADAIPAAEWVPVPGLGHDLPEGVWPLLLDVVERTAARAD